MTVFVDAHAFVWALFSPDRLSGRAASVLSDPASTLFCSEATLAELLNKCGPGRLPVAGSSVSRLYEDITALDVQFQPILQQDVVVAASLPHHHSDPFDRLLIAQAVRCDVPVLTVDGMFRRYDVQILW